MHAAKTFISFTVNQGVIKSNKENLISSLSVLRYTNLLVLYCVALLEAQGNIIEFFFYWKWCLDFDVSFVEFHYMRQPLRDTQNCEIQYIWEASRRNQGRVTNTKRRSTKKHSESLQHYKSLDILLLFSYNMTLPL